MDTRHLLATALAILAGAEPSLRSLSPSEIQDLISQEHGKVVLLNFWATWCLPCLEEFPDIVEVEKRYRHRGVAVISVSADHPDRIDSELRPFLEKHRPDFDVCLMREKDIERVPSSIDPEWTGKLPATFFFDRRGRPSVKRYSRMSREEIVKILDYLLDQPDR